MKKLLSSILAIIITLSMTSCGNKAENPFTQTGEIGGYTYPKFMQTDWGMTVEQAMTALGKSESDFKKSERDESSETIGRETIYKGTISINGIDETIMLFFINDAGKNGEPILGLTAVGVTLTNKENVSLAETAQAEFVKRKDTAKYSSIYDLLQANNANENYYDKNGYMSNVPTDQREKEIGKMDKDFSNRDIFILDVVDAADDAPFISIIKYNGKVISELKYCGL